MKVFEYQHIVGFEETNLVGNVYYANFLLWQGRCREMFLFENAPDILELLAGNLALVTTKVSCEFINELFAFDEITIKMRLGYIKQNRILMLFEYWRGEEIVARGEQEVACMIRDNGEISPTPVPSNLYSALQDYLE
ncbi:MAG TPA: acyl-CoA thioesterase [Pyrinomonadaceae bacterium]|nr:acyl-CoA thioesterase [Pyrinomonadaceae bacterium]